MRARVLCVPSDRRREVRVDAGGEAVVVELARRLVAAREVDRLQHAARAEHAHELTHVRAVRTRAPHRRLHALERVAQREAALRRQLHVLQPETSETRPVQSHVMNRTTTVECELVPNT